MTQSTLFMNNRSQSVRLPKAVAFPATVKQVEVIVVNGARIITPAGGGWDSWFDGPSVTSDFMSERDQPKDQTRESL
ncbi:type II toxin-antitoxin system VapB family antitoxin [Paralcaligenes ureilyticus]|uniref:Antitoxin VapB n=1 Tax=Paralcaligenes ureilyticus TaxID=627131 RepID=A0A4R3M2B1_9BURK|nr:type II toxin-antitoxin system VapB family antitoxin [Paralcaligenes ureilyticus]TCT06349.1 antitoxin VapB [Paralcaligenes ureilyticus]